MGCKVQLVETYVYVYIYNIYWYFILCGEQIYVIPKRLRIFQNLSTKQQLSSPALFAPIKKRPVTSENTTQWASFWLTAMG